MQKPTSLITSAVMLCKNRNFQEFMVVRHGRMFRDLETNAAEALYKECGISSRSELSSNKEAADKFNALVDKFKSAELQLQYEDIFSRF